MIRSYRPSDVMAYRDNRPFNPEDPIIVSETEIYCSGTCYVLAVIKEEEDNERATITMTLSIMVWKRQEDG